ncbi:MAG: AMP-binding protein [Actinobacteria bacterium]|nr:AMP-binding protein [Actinomycetota bacterium]
MTVDTDWSLPQDLGPLLARATELAALRPRYAHVDTSRPVRLADLPVLTKDDFAAARADLLARARAESAGSVVLGSGGTTSRPKLSVLPSEMFLPDMLTAWTPLDADDVLLNCNNGGELGSMNPFYNRLAHCSGAAVVPLGMIDPDALAAWLNFIADCGITAIGGTPSYLATVLECYESLGLRPPFRKVVWTGEAYNQSARRTTERVLPDAQRFGVYGSTETWVVGHNGPGCGWDVFHPMHYQHVELVDGHIVVTTTHPRSLNPILRYQIGDRGEWTACPCGRPEPGLRVLGRADQQIKFRSILFLPEEIQHIALTDPDVRDVQISLFDHGTPGERIEVRLRVGADADAPAVEERVGKLLMDQMYRIRYEVDDEPEAFATRVVSRFFVNHRTNKTPLLVKEIS